MAARVRFTEKVRTAFLEALRQHGNVRLAAEAAEISRSAVYQRKEADESFDAEWEAALEEAADRLEEEARRRAVVGVIEPHFHQGKVTGGTRKFSDQLLMFLLRGARPQKFRERVSVDATVKQRGPTVVRHQIEDPAELDEVVRILGEADVLPDPPARAQAARRKTTRRKSARKSTARPKPRKSPDDDKPSPRGKPRRKSPKTSR